MRRNDLGSTGFNVSSLGLGALNFGRWGTSELADCRRMVSMALDAGVTIFDTADVYSDGESERLLGTCLKGHRDRVTLATKVGRGIDTESNRSSLPDRITRVVEASISRLGGDSIDLLQWHQPLGKVDLELLVALDDLVGSGKVKAVGCCSTPADVLADVTGAARQEGLVGFQVGQHQYSVVARSAEAGALPFSVRHGIGVLVFGVLDEGWLSGRYSSRADLVGQSRMERKFAGWGTIDLHADWVAAKLASIRALMVLAAELGVTLPQLAVAWAGVHPAVDTVLLGPRTPDQLSELLAATSLRIPAEALDAIDRIVWPGTHLGPIDIGLAHPALAVGARRASARIVG